MNDNLQRMLDMVADAIVELRHRIEKLEEKAALAALIERVAKLEKQYGNKRK